MSQRTRPDCQDCSRETERKFVQMAVAATPANQERIPAIFAFQSNLLQNIVAFTPGNFQIDVLTEAFSNSRPADLNRLSAAEARSAFRQYVAFLDAARELHIDFVDFSRFQVLPGGSPRFAWKLEPQNLPLPARFIPFFNRCRHLRGLHVGNYRDFCRHNGAPVQPGEDSLYLCRRDDFASNLFRSRFPKAGQDGANVKVRIRTRFSWQKEVARGNLAHNLKNEEVLLLDFDLENTTLAERLAALCGRKRERKQDLCRQAQEFRLFMKKSIFREAVLLVDHLRRQEDDRLLRYLLEAGGIAGLTVILFGDAVGGECDLEFNDNPPNLLSGHLPGRVAAPVAPNRWEDEASAQLAALIAAADATDLEAHLRKQALENPTRIAPGPAAARLAEFLPNVAPGSRILEYGLDILIRGNCLELAAKTIAGLRSRLPVSIRLKKAHLALRRKDYRELGRLLAGMERPAAELKDEWLYLNFMYNEKIARKDRAGEYARKIKSPYYRHLALVQLSDRSIYRRDFPRARGQLTAAVDYFSAGGSLREAIEARNQMAKLLREEGDFAGAEAMYKTIYVEGEAGGLALNAAAAAVDLGNLYMESDDDFQAECWYKKAKRSFARERHVDGIMLVNSNLVNICVAKGCWLEADRLLGEILAWNEEKELPDSRAIDLLNQAGLEFLRCHDGNALEMIGRAEAIFRAGANSKGLGECFFLRARLSGFNEVEAGEPLPGCDLFNQDQEAVCSLLSHPIDADSNGRQGGLIRALENIHSKRIRFEALRLLLQKHRRREWLPLFREMAWELSPKTKNYFFYEYWYMVFDLACEGPPGAQRDEFLAMYDFFAVNRRSLPAKFARLRQQCLESTGGHGLFDDARLVERARHWRLPADFFHSFWHELGKFAAIDWLLMAVCERQRPLFRFASCDTFGELGEEMLNFALATPQDQSFDLQEVRQRFHSQERFFYPFTVTKVVQWPISEHLHASLIIAGKDSSLLFHDFPGRHREVFRKFSMLFQNFLQNEYRIREKLGFIVGTSEKVEEMKRVIAQVAKVDFSLLIIGESGSGKELVANAVHRLSPRADRPFVSLNAAAIPDTLLEAELFGYRKGAFSGAGDDRVGLLQAADGGTLFLDEIADLPLPLQAKLLRALQEREIRRLGENRTIHVDVRLISASNKDLGELSRGRLFRADLFYRLQDLVIQVPSLRERREDIPSLVAFFLEKYGYPRPDAVKVAAIAAMYRDDEFPGNVRELESRIKSLITFNPDLDVPPPPTKAPFNLRNARQEFEKRLLRSALVAAGWRKGLAAAKLGISRMALFNLIKKYGINE